MAKDNIIIQHSPVLSILLSCLAHALILVFVVGPYIDVAYEQEVIVLELDKQQPPKNKEKKSLDQTASQPSVRMLDQTFSGKPSKNEDKDLKTDELPERVDFAPPEKDEEVVPETVENPQTKGNLKQVRRSISSVWSKAEPPCSGIVEVRLKLGPEGQLNSIWITRLKGRSELGEFIRGMLRDAAPYVQAMHNASQQLIFDCRFEIKEPVE